MICKFGDLIKYHNDIGIVIYIDGEYFDVFWINLNKFVPSYSCKLIDQRYFKRLSNDL